jgi:hypothetical protein
MNTREKLAVYLTGQFVAVAALAAVVASMLGRFPFGDPLVEPVATTLPTRVAMWTTEAVGLVVLLGYPAAIVAVIVYGRSLDDHARYWSAVGITALSLPMLALVVAGGFLVGFRVGRLLAVAALVAGVLVLAVVVASTLGIFRGDGADDDDESDPRNRGNSGLELGETATLALTAVVCLGVLVGLVSVAGGADALVDERTPFGNPQVAFETTYEPVNDTHGVLTIRHDGGDAVPRQELFVRGAGITGVDGVDQTEPGAWAGESLRRDGGEHRVEPGNATTVGVRADCEVDVVYQRTDPAAATTLDAYECPDHEH